MADAVASAWGVYHYLTANHIDAQIVYGGPTTDEMSSMFGQLENADGDDDEVESQTATFPLLNQMFGSSNAPVPNEDKPKKEGNRNNTIFLKTERIFIRSHSYLY